MTKKSRWASDREAKHPTKIQGGARVPDGYHLVHKMFPESPVSRVPYATFGDVFWNVMNFLKMNVMCEK